MRHVVRFFVAFLAGVWCLSLAAWAASGGGLVVPGAPDITPAATIPVIQDGRVVQCDPSSLKPVTQYMLTIRCLDGERVVSEWEGGLILGFPAVIQDSRFRRGLVNFGSLIVIDTDEARLTPVPPVFHAQKEQSELSDITAAAYAAIRKASRVFGFGELKMAVYCPGATIIECDFQRQVTTAALLVKHPGELLPEFVPGVTQPVEWVGRFTAALTCPDLGYVGRDGTVYGDQPPEN